MQYDGVYTFGAKADAIELAPGINAKVLDERISLCKTKKSQTHVCFWEGDCQVTLSVEGQEVVINDHDSSSNTKRYFMLSGTRYYVQGHMYQMDGDEVVRLRYTVYKEI